MVESQPSKLLVAGSIPVSRSKRPCGASSAGSDDLSNEQVGGEPIGNFEQPVLAIVDPQSFGKVRSAIEGSFSSGRVADFLKSLARGSMRIRDFESVIRKGLLGAGVDAEYTKLGNGDQGQIREYYLDSLERVPADLRQRFFKLYAYY